jgi:AmmeMemoRadiSam system protein A
MPVTTCLLAAQELGYDKIKVLKYANSGDTFGNKGNVVGYLSAAIYKETGSPQSVVQQKDEKKREASGPSRRPGGKETMLNEAQRKELLRIARESIATFVKNGERKRFVEKDPILNEVMGAFVTLHEAGELRGCIGNMVGHQPLCQTVSDMAIEAATGDPRFPPISAKELEMIDIEISVLTPLKRVPSYKDVQIPGDGVLVKRGFRSGVYLPQVATETGWNRDEFLTSLCGHKAGMAPDAWKDPATEIYTFSAEVFGEKEEKR